MSREVEAIASALFDKIRTRFEDVRLGDEKSKATTDPEKARFINFDYTINDKKIGNITISLIDENSLKIYYGKDIVDKLKELDNEMEEDADKGSAEVAQTKQVSFAKTMFAMSHLKLKAHCHTRFQRSFTVTFSK